MSTTSLHFSPFREPAYNNQWNRDISHFHSVRIRVMYLCKKRCNVLCPIPQRFSTPAASRLCLQKLLDFHPEISFFSFCFWFSNIAVGRGGSVRRTNSLNYEDWTFTSYYSSLHSTNSNHKRISGQMCFCLAVPKFYLELAESRQNLWLSEWELSLSQ